MCLRYSTSHYISKTKPGIVKDKIYKNPASYSLFCFGKKKFILTLLCIIAIKQSKYYFCQ